MKNHTPFEILSMEKRRVFFSRQVPGGNEQLPADGATVRVVVAMSFFTYEMYE